MKSNDIKNPLYPLAEVRSCMYFRRNHDMLLGSLSELLFHVIFAGHYVCSTGFHVDRKMEPSALLLLTLSGEGDFRYRGTRVTLKRGSCFLIDTQFHHEYFPVNDGWEFKYVHFRGGNTADLLEYLEPRGPVFTLDEGELWRAETVLGRVLDGTEPETIEDYPGLSGEVYSLLMLLMSHNGKKPGGESVNTPRPMAYAVDFIRRNYAGDISVAEIARAVNLSRSALFELFRLTYGMPPHEYLTQYRLSVAKNMLTNTSLAITGIAEQTGFRDIYAFSRRFREKNGVPPSEYRRMNKTSRAGSKD